MVDLLLVRLTSEDEKNKVVNLLMSELGMSREEARDKVDNSPNILSEGVEMEQGRILQDRMYPFVDLLPRHYDAKSTVKAAKDNEPEESPYELITDDIAPLNEEKGKQHPDSGESNDIYHNPSAITEEDYAPKSFDDKDDDSLIITSASEEMLSIERCHICGRTPTGDQKLAPCQTCGDLTCANCYNRKHHVCNKCAAAGRVVDRPLDSVPEKREEIPDEDRNIEAKYDSSKRISRPVRTGTLSRNLPLAIILTSLILVAAFIIIDPMNLFTSPDNSTDGTAVLPVDTCNEADSVEVPDTTLIPEADMTVTPDDSLFADSVVSIKYISLRDISVPDSLGIGEGYSLPRILNSSPVAGIEIQTDSLPFIADILGQLASVYSIEFDGISLIRTHDGFDILLMSILHPEPAEKRTALLGNLGTALDSTIVDQMVLYYRENQYYEAEMFTFTADSFSILARSNSPNFLQRKQAVIHETTELITGRILDWMTDLN